MLDRFRQLGYPEIAPVPEGVRRPLWSVMIPTYNCAVLLRETLKSVLAQDPGRERMQIEVIDDASTKDDPEAVVRELGQGRVTFFRHPKNVGATANFNICLSRSRGHLVHILHGDDVVLPGFYAHMEDLLDQNPGAGSGICRYAIMDEDSLWTKLIDLRQRTKGIYANALPTIVSLNWAQFAAVVLRRSLAEAIGGFHPALIHAADWDLWKRAALHQPVAYEPTVLACYRVFEGNDTSRLMRSGANLADIRRSIDLSSQYLPQPDSGAWVRDARNNCAHFAAASAFQRLLKGDRETFRNQLREVCLLDPSFWRSREHINHRYRYARQIIKRGLVEIQDRLSKARSLKPARNSATTRTGSC